MDTQYLSSSPSFLAPRAFSVVLSAKDRARETERQKGNETESERERRAERQFEIPTDDTKKIARERKRKVA